MIPIDKQKNLCYYMVVNKNGSQIGTGSQEINKIIKENFGGKYYEEVCLFRLWLRPFR